MKTSQSFIFVTTFTLIAAAAAGCTDHDHTAVALGAGGAGLGGSGGQPAVASGSSDLRTGPQCGYASANRTPQATASLASEIAPAPPSIRADVPATYFGPSPSSVNPNLVGPLTLLEESRPD